MLRKISVDSTFCIMAAAAILLLPLKWLFAAFCAAMVHELSHYLALRLCGAQVESVRIGGRGAAIMTESLSAGKEALCAVAGPLGGFLLVFLAPVFPEMAVCALAQSAFNLLPIYPLDGGRIRNTLASLLLAPQMARKFCSIIQISAKLMVIFMCVYLSLKLHFGVVPVMALLLFLGKKDLAN